MKILHVISSPRGENSVSIKLGNAIIERLKSVNQEVSVKVHNLTKNPFPHLEEVHIASFFTPPESRTDDQVSAIKYSDNAISEINEADIIVIGVPMYNFGIHSTLKAWIDHIARAGVTFTYTQNGPEGLIKGKKVYLAIASGGVYSEGSMRDFDFTESYLKVILGFIGMTNIATYRVEGLALDGVKETALEKAINKIHSSLIAEETV